MPTSPTTAPEAQISPSRRARVSVLGSEGSPAQRADHACRVAAELVDTLAYAFAMVAAHPEVAVPEHRIEAVFRDLIDRLPPDPRQQLATRATDLLNARAHARRATFGAGSERRLSRRSEPRADRRPLVVTPGDHGGTRIRGRLLTFVVDVLRSAPSTLGPAGPDRVLVALGVDDDGRAWRIGAVPVDQDEGHDSGPLPLRHRCTITIDPSDPRTTTVALLLGAGQGDDLAGALADRWEALGEVIRADVREAAATASPGAVADASARVLTDLTSWILATFRADPMPVLVAQATIVPSGEEQPIECGPRPAHLTEPGGGCTVLYRWEVTP